MGIQPYQGFKWRLTCSNAEGVVAKSLMYGKPLY